MIHGDFTFAKPSPTFCSRRGQLQGRVFFRGWIVIVCNIHRRNGCSGFFGPVNPLQSILSVQIVCWCNGFILSSSNSAKESESKRKRENNLGVRYCTVVVPQQNEHLPCLNYVRPMDPIFPKRCADQCMRPIHRAVCFLSKNSDPRLHCEAGHFP